MAVQSTWQDVLKSDLKRDEGLRLKTYIDTVGVRTIGYGHTKNVKSKQKITQEQADALLDADIEVAIAGARIVCPCFDQLDGPRKTVIANMSFNLGMNRLALFQRTLAAVCSGKYQDAALHMMQSKWASQVKQRAVRLAKRMSTGEW